MKSKLNISEKCILIGILVVFLLSIPLHFLYDFSNKSALAALFSPVNESIFEHLKLAFYPIIIYWFISYFIILKKENVNTYNWFVSATISSVVAPCIIVALYYVSSYAFNINSLIIDILFLLISVCISQILALHVYQHSSYGLYDLYTAISVIFFVVLIFTFFTFAPPNYPIFEDPINGTYGIGI